MKQPLLWSWIDPLNRGLGQLSSILVLISTVLVFIVVLWRYLLDGGSVALQEAGVWLHSAAFLLAAAWTLRLDGHVRVDVFYQSFSPRRKAWVEIIGGVLLLIPFCGFMMITSWPYVEASWAVYERSPETGGLPGLFLLKSFIPVAAFSLLLQAVAQVLDAIVSLRAPQGIGMDQWRSVH